jgi:hypothetical protein
MIAYEDGCVLAVHDTHNRRYTKLKRIQTFKQEVMKPESPTSSLISYSETQLQQRDDQKAGIKAESSIGTGHIF